ncbi:MAG: sec-independent protein translocase protein TatC [Planctomycetota bacterium]|jgi:sec-independent protein translocase protein TatC
MTDTSQPQNDQEQPLIAHLAELRDRLLRALTCVFAVFLVLSFFANDIYHAVAMPLLAQMPENTTMIATEVASPFLVPFKLAFFAAVFITMPYILYQSWAFIAPGLYQKELYFAMPLLVTSIILFYVGISFAYFVVFPLLFGFLTSAAPEGVSVMTDISHYLDFVLKLFFAFGLAFEVPIATILLITTGITTTEALAEKRAYIIVGAFAIGMLLTPPDVVSQILLAVPIWLLFESGLLLSKYFKPDDKTED